MKSFVFYFFDYPWIKYDSTFEICFGYKRKYGDMMCCDLNFFLMKYLTLVSSVMSTGIIVDTIRLLSMGIIVDIYIPWW